MMKKEGWIAGIFGILGAGLASINFISAWSFTEMLNQWDSIGVFDYILPFLIVFAIVFGILSKANIFGDNKGVNVILALALGLLSLVGNYVPRFFQAITPNLAIGLSVLLAAIIFLGLWAKEETYGKVVNWGLVILGALIFIFVIYSSFEGNVGGLGYLWDEYGPALITLLILIGIIALVIFWGKESGGAPAHQ
jgi:hypothetical protein